MTRKVYLKGLRMKRLCLGLKEGFLCFVEVMYTLDVSWLFSSYFQGQYEACNQLFFGWKD